MNLAISNIAWEASEDESIASMLRQFAVTGIDVAPTKYFPDPASTTDAAVRSVRDWWHQRGIGITGMQALLFGTAGLNVFGSSESQCKMLEHLSAVCKIAAGLGAPRIVFGSPKNRDRAGLNDQGALEVACSFFSRLGSIGEAHGVTICLEPNPARYGCNFMMTSEETASVVRTVAHPMIRMQFDTGALAINGEDPFEVLQLYGDVIGHIHLSEPDLLPLGDGQTDHTRMASALRQFLSSRVLTIEMLATQNEPHIDSIERALKVAVHHYRDAAGGAPE